MMQTRLLPPNPSKLFIDDSFLTLSNRFHNQPGEIKKAVVQKPRLLQKPNILKKSWAGPVGGLPTTFTAKE
jgi:hypothetical protein